MNSSRKGLVEHLSGKALHLLFRMRRGLTLGVRAVAMNGDGAVLLVRHTYTSGWHFPGGGGQSGQTAVEALADELRQETSLRLTGRPQLHGIFLNLEASDRDHILVYRCKCEGDLPEVSPSLEIAEMGFFDETDLPADIDPRTGRRLKELAGALEPGSKW